jgi:uncharacterized protein YcbX
MGAKVSRIAIAPVKALGLVHPQEVVLGPNGVAGDRRFWLRDENARLFNGKRDGRLQQIRPTWEERSQRLLLAFPDRPPIDGVVELGEPVDATMYGEPRPSRRVLGPWQEAISQFLGKPLELLWAEDGAVDRSTDGGAASLVSTASLDRLRRAMATARPVDGRRFRMLFEIDGIGPHEEDRWIGRHVQVGDAELVVTGDVGRCVVTTRDPDTGVSDMPTLATLAAYRRAGRNEPLPFGVKAAVHRPGCVRVGDIVAPR